MLYTSTQVRGDHTMASPASAKRRLSISITAGVTMALLLLLLGAGKFAPLAAWDTAALVYISWVWIIVWGMDASNTKSHANTEDPGRAVADVLLIAASVVSLVAVGFIIMQASSSQGIEKTVEVVLGLLSVVISWATVHTMFALKYASLYYGKPEGGIDFGQTTPPQYTDFAYMAFTIGLTFQVSDTQLHTVEIRKTVLKQALLSYLFGAVIIATVINTIANLGK